MLITVTNFYDIVLLAENGTFYDGTSARNSYQQQLQKTIRSISLSNASQPAIRFSAATKLAPIEIAAEGRQQAQDHDFQDKLAWATICSRFRP